MQARSLTTRAANKSTQSEPHRPPSDANRAAAFVWALYNARMPHDLLRLARDYLESIGKADELGGLSFFADDVVQIEFPNRLVPNGATRDLAALRDAAERGRKVMTAQRFEIVNAIASGEQVAVEAIWTGTLAVPLGSLPAGGQMRARFAIFLTYRDGKIVRQHNYDCFDPW
jgi:ketosteroid isomerase-like protein